MNSENFERKNPPWVAISHGYRDKPFDEQTAIGDLTDCCKFRRLITLRGFARECGWSNTKARRFLRQAGVKIYYPKSKPTRKSKKVCYSKVEGELYLRGGYLRLIPERELDSKKEHLRALIIYTKQEYNQLDLSGELRLTDLPTDLQILNFSRGRCKLVKLSA